MKLRTIKAALIAAAMAMQSFTFIPNVSAASNQISSEKEIVYANIYDSATREQNFDSNWKFYLGQATNAEATTFDDSAWESVNLPHDYSIEQEFTTAGEAESGYLLGGTGWYRKHFSLTEDMEGKQIRIDFGGVYMNATIWVNGQKLGTHPYGYTPFSFDITDYVTFDKENVITVKVDHQTPSSRWYSGSGIYRSVELVVMDKVHVDLYGTQITTPNLEAEKDGDVKMNVETTVANDGTKDASVSLVHTIYEKGTENSIGSVITNAVSVKANESKVITSVLEANKPKLWTVGEGNLYTVVTEVKVDEKVVDTYETEYGFRYFKFDTHTGFYINGEPVKLKGVCMHHDQGALGSEDHYRAIERQVEILMDMGCNSIRVTHNPASENLIKVCNEKGVLLIEEVFDGWMFAKNGNSNDYSRWFATPIESGNQILGADATPMSATDNFLGNVNGLSWAQFDLTATINRGYNEPSIIMWSLGNEIWEGAGGHEQFPPVAQTLINWASALDDSRPCTTGDNKLKAQASYSYEISSMLSAANGPTGANYCNGAQYDAVYNYYKNTEGFALYGSETASHINSRGVYYKTSGNSNKELTAYDYSAVGWGATASSAWYDVITRDYVAGEYVWTGFDYIGEPTTWNGTGTGAVGDWPSPKNSFFGIIDTAGLPKDNFYFYQSQWNDEVTTLHVLPAWNRDVVSNPTSVPVVVYSDAASVKLTLTTANGTVKDLGTRTFTEKTTGAGYKYQIYEGDGKQGAADRNLYLTWYVPFEEGTISATAYDKAGNVISETVGRNEITTTGDEAKVDAIVDRNEIKADGKDLAYITVNITDKDGNIVPDAKNNVKFSVQGDGVLVGVDNGKQADHQSYQDNNRNAYNGSLIAIVQSTKEAGQFSVTASADGLESDTITVKTTSKEATNEVYFNMSKNYYVQVGTKPELPTTIETTINGTAKALSVKWDTINATDYAKAGTFSVNGMVDGKYSVSVNVNVIDEVAAMLNYSTSTLVGNAPELPTARPVVMKDGTVLDALFAVEWPEIDEAFYAQAGTFVVNGKANVFGKELDVTASVRVEPTSFTIGGNTAEQLLKITQDIPENLQSDTLLAIKDGSIAISDNNDGGPNESAWSNYDATRAGDNDAELVFEYATQTRLAQIKVYYWKDSNAVAYPDPNTTKFYVSDNGTDYTEIEVKETIGTEKDRVCAYTYDFDLVTATFVKLVVTNKAGACSGITEVELNEAKVKGLSVNTTDGFESLVVNGTALSASQLEKDTYATVRNYAKVEAVGKNNAAVTVLPRNEKEIVIITESEDHVSRSTFTILLGTEVVDGEQKDYPKENTTPISDSQYLPGTPNEGPDDYVIDGESSTHWHTNWSTSEAMDVNKRWIGLSLPELTKVDGIRYLPRNGNGSVTEYRVEYRTSDNGTWQTLKTGNWSASDPSWKVVSFDAVEVKQIRVVGVHTYADSGNDAHMSCAELRVTVPLSQDLDKSVLKETIDEAKALNKDNFTADSWYVLESTLKTAEEVYADEKSNQDDIDLMMELLLNAMKNLDPKEEDKPLDPTPTPDPKPAMNFVDVKEGAWFYGSVESAYQKGLMSNTGKGKEYFEPDTAISRGMVATVLYRMAGLPKVEFKATFSDVTNAKLWYSTAITWASQNGVVSGYKDGRFGPDDNITRQDLAIMLRNFAKANGLDTNAKVDFSAFKDGNKVVSYAQSAVQFCIDAKLMSGSKKADGVYLNPTDKATRAECAKMFSLLDDAIKAK